MAHLLIWGETREILPGELAATAASEEVHTLAKLRAALHERVAGAMVLADPRLLEAEREPIETWLRNGGSAQAYMVAVADLGEGDETLRRLPFVDDVLVRPVTPVRLVRKLEQAIDAVRNRRVIRQLEKKVSRREEELSELNEIGVKLSAERDIDKLLDLILKKSREITGSDAGSLYLVERAQLGTNGEGDRLRFKLAHNDSVDFSFQESTMPLDKTSIAGYVALTGVPVNVHDAYRLPDGTPYRISRSFDERSGYRTKSMLVVPMKDHRDLVIGVVQLINKKRDRSAVLQPPGIADEEVIPFSSEDERLAGSLASQAAVAFENADLLQRIRLLFETFVHAAVDAVEQRDPTTSGHSERVAILTVGLMEKVDQIQSGPLASERYTRDQVEEVRYAALLHDFGKVAVQEKYLRKGKKLYASQLIAIKQRFAYILKAIEADYLRKRLAPPGSGAGSLEAIEADYERRRSEAEQVLAAVVAANEPSVIEEQSFQALMSLPTRRFASFEALQAFPVEDWAQGPYLSSDELDVLSIRKGSLSEQERSRIQDHVSESYRFLQKLPWTSDLQRVPEIAWAHHEKLDGSGYPRKLTAKDIPRPSQMMTISDIYDALVAWDRPYKSHVTPERARAILCEDAQAGRLDQELLRVFLEAEVYELPAFRELLQKKA